MKAGAAHLSRRGFMIAGAALAGVGFLPRSSSAQYAREPIRLPGAPLVRDFSVLWKGDEVGFHRIAIEPDQGNDTARVLAAIEIKVKIAFVTAYRFTHQSEELWRGGVIDAFEGVTDDDGEAVNVKARRVGGDLEIEGPGGALLVDSNLPTSNAIWSVRSVTWPEAIDAQLGNLTGWALKSLGRETIEVRSQPLTAARYEFTTPYSFGDVWYDDAGILAKLHMVKEGEEIDYALKA
jgi:hypothetical protein